MGFLGVYRAVYDYTPQGEGELAITEGDILYLLEKSSEDDWWRAKKKASGDDDDEPVGLIPSNYIEEVSLATAHELSKFQFGIAQGISSIVHSNEMQYLSVVYILFMYGWILPRLCNSINGRMFRT